MSDGIEVIYSSWYNAEVAAVPGDQQVRIEQRIRAMLGKGWTRSIADRTVAPLRDGIYEIRVLGTGPAYRVLFFIVPGRSPRVIVLTACVAKSVMTKRQRLDAERTRASERRAAWIEQQRKREDDARG